MLIVKGYKGDSYFWNTDTALEDLNEKITTRYMQNSSNRDIWVELNANWKKFKHADVCYYDRNNDFVRRCK